MDQLYQYVGPAEIAHAVNMDTPRMSVLSAADVRNWMAAAQEPGDSITVTFVVDRAGKLWIADRHSEHVACARGDAVLSAGEITFQVAEESVTATCTTNQSTGYCPRPDSWTALAQSLDRAGIAHSGDFDARYEFRRCECGQINLVKSSVFECAVCGSGLPADWNVTPVDGT